MAAPCGFTYWRYGFKQNFVLILIFVAILLVYLWRALPRVYATSGWNALLRAFLLMIGLEISRAFFMTFTMILAMVQTMVKH
jgi:hypothetical protein